MSLASRLKDLRLTKGKSLQEVADAVGASKPHIWELERGTSNNPSLELVKNLANYFGVKIDYLAGDEEETIEEQAELMHFFRELKSQNPDPADLEVLKAAAQALYKNKK
ncbi:MAG TPA: helix-turn-helix transcriptional regulator [Methylotenera sp.]